MAVFGTFGLQAWNEYRAFDESPRQVDLLGAVHAADNGKQWVSVSNAPWQCNGELTRVPGGFAFLPAIASDGSVVVARFDHAIDCKALLGAPFVGVIEPMDFQRISDLRAAGLALPEDVALRTLDVCSFCGRPNSRLGVIVCAVFVLLGMFIYPLRVGYQRLAVRGRRWLFDTVNAPSNAAAKSRLKLRALGSLIIGGGAFCVAFGADWSLAGIIPLRWAGGLMLLFGAYIAIFPERYRSLAARGMRNR